MTQAQSHIKRILMFNLKNHGERFISHIDKNPVFGSHGTYFDKGVMQRIIVSETLNRYIYTGNYLENNVDFIEIEYNDSQGVKRKDSVVNIVNNKQKYDYLMYGYIDCFFDEKENVLTIKCIDVNPNCENYNDMVTDFILYAIKLTMSKPLRTFKVELDDFSHQFGQSDNIYKQLGFVYESKGHPEMVGDSNVIFDKICKRTYSRELKFD